MAARTDSEAAQGKLRNREKVIEAQRKKDIQAVMALPEGRRFVYDLIFNRCGLMDVYIGAGEMVLHHEGRRIVGSELTRELQASQPALYTQMITEKLREQASEQALRDAAEIE